MSTHHAGPRHSHAAAAAPRAGLDLARLWSTLASLALLGTTVVAAYAGTWLVAVVVVVVQLMIASAPEPAEPDGRSVHAPRFVAAAAGGVVGTVVTTWPSVLVGAHGTQAGDIGDIGTGVFAGLVPAMAVGTVLALLSQMVRKDGRRQLVRTTSYAVTLAAFAGLAIGWIGARQSLGAQQVVVVAAVALGVALLVWTLPLDRLVAGGLAVVAGAVSGAVMAPVMSDAFSMTLWFGAVLGLGTAMFGVLGQVVGRAWSMGRLHAASGWGFPAAMSLALAAPIVYVGGQLVGAG